MIRWLLILTLTTLAVAQSHPYTTSFSGTENPLSEGGVWLNGAANGTSWHNCNKTPGQAFGTQTGSTQFDDSICILTSAWNATQSASGTVKINAGDASTSEEVELLLRFSISAGNAHGYEINCSVRPGNPYITIVKWQGALGSFTTLATETSVGCVNGTVLSATISGTSPPTITASKDGVVQLTAQDNNAGGTGPWTSGAPGMGFYMRGSSSAFDANFGYSSYTAASLRPISIMSPRPGTIRLETVPVAIPG